MKGNPRKSASTRLPSRGAGKGTSDPSDSLLPQVVQWDEEIRSFLRTSLEQAASDADAPVPLERIYLAERSIELLLDRAFRKKYEHLLKKYAPAAAGRYMASDPEAGRALLQELGIISVVPPPKAPGGPGLLPPHQFPLPVTHHRSRAARGRAGQPGNIRLLLDHLDFLGWHPAYLLVCTRCGWLQGALGGPVSYASDIPYPPVQVKTWWREAGEEVRRGDTEFGYLIDELVREFSEEVWGFDAAKTWSPRAHSSWRHPTSSGTASVLDFLAGFSGFPDVSDRQEAEARQFRRAEALALILRQLRCQACTVKRDIRYMPRIMLPLDADLSTKSQSDSASSLSKLLDGARDRVSKEPRAAKVIWIPTRFPRIRLSELSQRFELRHEERIPAEKRTPNLWLVALWLLDVASASARRGDRSRSRRRTSKDTRMTWSILFDELGMNRGDPLEQEMNRLRIKVDRLVGSKKVHHHHLIYRVRALLDEPDSSEAASLFARYYLEEVLQKRIDELKRSPQ